MYSKLSILFIFYIFLLVGRHLMNISITVMQGEVNLIDELNTQATTKLTAGMFFFICLLYKTL